MKILLASLIFLSSVASARSVSCDLTESKDQKETQSQVLLPVGEDLSAQIVTFFGILNLNFSEGAVRLSLPDASSKLIVDATLSAREADTFRLQMFPYAEKFDYLDVICSMTGEEQVLPKPSGAACTLTETSGTQKVATNFQIPIALSGHDVFTLPAAKLATISGWVMAYNGILVHYMQGADNQKSVSSISAWDRPFRVSWHPAQQGVVAELKCDPLF